MARSTTDDIRDILAYYRIQAQDRAQEQWKAKMEELHKKKVAMGGTRLGTPNVPQAAP